MHEIKDNWEDYTNHDTNSESDWEDYTEKQANSQNQLKELLHLHLQNQPNVDRCRRPPKYCPHSYKSY